MNVTTNTPDAKSFAEMPKAPLASSFPANPASWYLFCHRDDLRKGPLAKRMLNRDLVAFQTASGKVAVLDARCSHLGANLGCGVVLGEAIQCPFHNWQFASDGRCQNIPGSVSIPAFARQQRFPVAELHGFIFFFNGNEALFPLPFFNDETPQNFRAARLFSYEADASWFMVAAQGFDRQHFETVHDRRLLSPPKVDSPTPFVRRNQWHAEIIGTRLPDKILRAVVGKNVSLTIHNWGGTLYTVKAEFSRACSRFLVSYRPIENDRTHFDVIVFARAGVASLGLGARRWLTRAHLVSEASQVRNTQYRPARLIPADNDMIECFRWLAALPQQASTDDTDLMGRSHSTNYSK
jgi:phenylpropionate dioxygenase-like ring-hydroxylating dioxygenase large terminal subunit